MPPSHDRPANPALQPTLLHSAGDFEFEVTGIEDNPAIFHFDDEGVGRLLLVENEQCELAECDPPRRQKGCIKVKSKMTSSFGTFKLAGVVPGIRADLECPGVGAVVQGLFEGAHIELCCRPHAPGTPAKLWRAPLMTPILARPSGSCHFTTTEQLPFVPSASSPCSCYRHVCPRHTQCVRGCVGTGLECENAGNPSGGLAVLPPWPLLRQRLKHQSIRGEWSHGPSCWG